MKSLPLSYASKTPVSISRGKQRFYDLGWKFKSNAPLPGANPEWNIHITAQVEGGGLDFGLFHVTFEHPSLLDAGGTGDKLKLRFYYNADTGKFLGSPEIPPENRSMLIAAHSGAENVVAEELTICRKVADDIANDFLKAVADHTIDTKTKTLLSVSQTARDIEAERPKLETERARADAEARAEVTARAAAIGAKLLGKPPAAPATTTSTAAERAAERAATTLTEAEKAAKQAEHREKWERLKQEGLASAPPAAAPAATTSTAAERATRRAATTLTEAEEAAAEQARRRRRWALVRQSPGQEGLPSVPSAAPAAATTSTTTLSSSFAKILQGMPPSASKEKPEATASARVETDARKRVREETESSDSVRNTVDGRDPKRARTEEASGPQVNPSSTRSSDPAQIPGSSPAAGNTGMSTPGAPPQRRRG